MMALARLAVAIVVALTGAAPPASPPALEDSDIARPAPPAQAPPAREIVVDIGDLDAIKKRGALRVLVFGDNAAAAGALETEPYLPRDGGGLDDDFELV